MLQGWITYDNRTVTMNEMSHQHMSNIWHYISAILPEHYPNTIRVEIMNWLNKRFGGIVLPYHPVPNFQWEREYLKQKGYLQENNDIVINNQIIGWYE